jgi:hypothetical protein
MALDVLLPGTVDAAYVRVDDLGSGGRLVGARISTSSDPADAVGSYLARADYYAAETMVDWADQAEQMLHAKMSDPFAATVGAYLLSRLGHYDRMRTWARNLADWFPALSDGCVIWALQALRQHNDGEEARKYLLEAVFRGHPIHTEGLKLLSQGLRLIGEPGEKALADLGRKTGRVLWTSPFTAVCEGTPSPGAAPTTFEVGYMPVV